MNVKDLCDKYNIIYYKINKDNSIDVYNSVYLNGYGLSKLPLKFNKIYGDFFCNYNELKTLEGCPKYVTKSFDCSFNKLTSLKWCPKSVGGTFDCRKNKLTTNTSDNNIIKGKFISSLKENKLNKENYNEWNKIKKRKKIINKILK
tara:strand:+ start:1165 stop:1602 length:438 start_codon:yes stop_codon:yes gene_type:complete